MRSRLFVPMLTILFLLVGHLHSQDFKFRKFAGEFMEIGVDARAQALGGAFTAIQGGVVSAYYNPAGILNIQGTQISFMHTQQLIASVNYDYMAVGHRQSENRILAVSLIRLGIDNIKDSREAQQIISQSGDWNIDYSKIKEFNASDYIFMLTMAQTVKKKWMFGANLKLVRRNIADHHANGLGFDLGVQRRFLDNAIFGANIKNITTTLLAWNTGEKELVKPALFIGGSYLFDIPALASSFQPVIDLVFRGENRRQTARSNIGMISMDLATGLEYIYHDILSLRLGMDEIERLNMGVGLQIPHIRIDYGFTSYDKELGNSHRIGLVIAF